MPRPTNHNSSKIFLPGIYGLAVVAFPLITVPCYAGSVTSKEIEEGVSQQRSERLIVQSENSEQVKDDKENDVTLPPSSEDIDKEGKSTVEIEEESRVLISEVVIEGVEGHPDEKRLEYAAYDAMKTRPGTKVTRSEVKLDLDSIYATGWFSAVRIEPSNGPLGVQLLVKVQPNPVLKRIEILPQEIRLLPEVIDNVFQPDYGKTLNLNVLQLRMRELKKWYADQGYSLARISGPNRVTPEGLVQLNVQEGFVSNIEIQFLNKDGDSVNEDGKEIKGKTKDWVIRRELSTNPGDVFNRKKLESDIKRLYSTSLFNDVKVSLKPKPGEPGAVTIVLAISEQRTGSLTGGIGYSGSQGVFGQVGLQETNLLGRSWTSNMNMTYGEYGALLNLSLYDPWIKGDKNRTSVRTSLFLSREVPQEFRSQEGGNIRGVSDSYTASNTSRAYDIAYAVNGVGPFSTVAAAKSSASDKSWFDYEGDSVVIEKTGGGFSFSRPLNGGDPLKKVPWSVLVGMNFQKVRPIDYAGESRPYGVSSTNYSNNSALTDDVICVAYNCADENTLVSFKVGATYNKLDDTRNPTSGDYVTFGSEQFVSVGENSPTFNRARVSYAHFIPVNWLKLHKGCRPKPGEPYKCPQAIGLQVKTGAILGELPPYEAFCVGGSSSIRGWASCDLGVGKRFGEASAEYRFPIWRIISGSVFFDAGSTLGSQRDVPGKPGKLLQKPGVGTSLGTGVVVTTPVGPLRLEAANQDLTGEWRYNFGVGWKF